jgi:hypothetical protein
MMMMMRMRMRMRMRILMMTLPVRWWQAQQAHAEMGVLRGQVFELSMQVRNFALCNDPSLGSVTVHSDQIISTIGRELAVLVDWMKFGARLGWIHRLS